MEALKKIGIIGGSGPEATSLLYDYIFDIARKKHGAERLEQYPHLMIASVPLLQDVSSDSDIEKVVNRLKEGAEGLKAAGAEVMCLACNTHHLSIDKIREHVGVDFISMIDLVTDRAKELGAKKVAVIGTGYTLRNALYGDALAGEGIELVDIGDELTERSHKIISEALSGIKPEMVDEYIKLVNEIAENYEFDALVLGCTEYSVLDHRRDKTLPFPGIKIIDPLKELAEAIAEASYKTTN